MSRSFWKPLQCLLTTFLLVFVTVNFALAQVETDATDLELLPISKAGKYGLMRADGKVVIAPTFAERVMVGDDKWPRLLVKGNERINAKYAFLGRDGRLIADFEYTYAKGFSEGLAPVCKGRKDSMLCGYIDETGKVAIDLHYSINGGFEKQYFNGQLAAACVGYAENTRCGFIDRKGNEVVELKYDNVWQGKDGLVSVCSDAAGDRRCGLTELGGKVVVAIGNYNSIHAEDGMASVCIGKEESRRCGYVEYNGKVIAEPIYWHLGKFEDGIATVCVGKYHSKSQCGFIDRSGKVIAEPKFKITSYDSQPFKDGLAHVCSGTGTAARCDYIDKSGKVITTLYTSVGKYSEGLIDVCTGGQGSSQCGYIDSAGKVVIELANRLASAFSEGRAAVCTLGATGILCGYIDRAGKAVLEPTYGMAEAYHNGLAVVCNKTAEHLLQCGVVDHDGNLAVPLQYDGISGFNDVALASVVKQGEYYGLINRTGKLIAEPKYTRLDRLNERYFELCTGDEEHLRCGLIDTSGMQIAEIKYAELRSWSDDGLVIMACINEHGCSLIDQSEISIAQPTYESIDYFHDPKLTKACVKSGKKTQCGIINRSGKPIISFRFEHVELSSQGVVTGCVKKGKMASCVYMNLSGNRIGDYGMQFPIEKD